MGRVGSPARGEAGAPLNPEMLPQALPLRNPSSSSLHKRLYPRWYQAYVYKVSGDKGAQWKLNEEQIAPILPVTRSQVPIPSLVSSLLIQGEW